VTFRNHLLDRPNRLAGYWPDDWSAEAQHFVRPAAKTTLEMGF
jgi:hypothetical protein